VFEDLSFELQAGEQLAVVGESGAGKSTLLHLLGALDRPSGGSVFYGDRDIFLMTSDELADFRNRHIGFVWQQQSLLPEFTAMENVMMPLLIRGVPRAEAESRAAGCLAEVGLSDRGHHRSGELSGGEQQRVALARALVTAPPVLLADEPTGNLDHRTGETIIALLRELHHTHSLTSVIVTHNLSFAQRCDRILQLNKGADSASGSGQAGLS
jgi:lipoprotein-releasing system ATP-binding protein